jgi:hypothetical protein
MVELSVIVGLAVRYLLREVVAVDAAIVLSITIF